jgi:Tfp pilus assembly protein PilE
VYKNGDNLDYKNYRGIFLLNVAYRVFAKVLHSCLLPYANAQEQHYQKGYHSGKSTTDQLFALEKINVFNITNHHLFIDFKVAYDTITRNEIYVIMAELNFPTSNQSNDDNCQVLRQNTERLFGPL